MCLRLLKKTLEISSYMSKSCTWLMIISAFLGFVDFESCGFFSFTIFFQQSFLTCDSIYVYAGKNTFLGFFNQTILIAVNGVLEELCAFEGFMSDFQGPVLFLVELLGFVCALIQCQFSNSLPQAETGDLLFSPGHLLTVAHPCPCPLTPSSLPPSLQSICHLPALRGRCGWSCRLLQDWGDTSAATGRSSRRQCRSEGAYMISKKVVALSVCHRRSPQQCPQSHLDSGTRWKVPVYLASPSYAGKLARPPAVGPAVLLHKFPRGSGSSLSASISPLQAWLSREQWWGWDEEMGAAGHIWLPTKWGEHHRQLLTAPSILHHIGPCLLGEVVGNRREHWLQPENKGKALLAQFT